MLKSSSYVYQFAINKNDVFIANTPVGFILKKQELVALKSGKKCSFNTSRCWLASTVLLKKKEHSVFAEMPIMEHNSSEHLCGGDYNLQAFSFWKIKT